MCVLVCKNMRMYVLTTNVCIYMYVCAYVFMPLNIYMCMYECMVCV